MKSLIYVENSWDEIKSYLKKEKDIILPASSIEQHGYHLPLNTDTIITEAISRRVSKEIGALVAPTIEYTYCGSGVYFPGTVSVNVDVLKKYVQNILSDFHRIGFKRIHIIAGHGSRPFLSCLRLAGREVSERTDMDINLFFLYSIDLSDIIETEPHHADEVETSLMLYLKPELVDMDRYTVDTLESPSYSVRTKLHKNASGVWGNPYLATREKGKKALEKLTNEIVKAIRKGSQNGKGVFNYIRRHRCYRKDNPV